MLSSPALFSACHESKWRSIYLCLQAKGGDFYLTVEQGNVGNVFLKVKREDVARVSAFFAAPSYPMAVTCKPAKFAWFRLSFSKNIVPGVINLRIFRITPLSIQFTSVPFAVGKLMQLGLTWQTLATGPHKTC
ncbi:hypothetical protein [Pseudomonas sp. IPO3774]|jgi:hypothetical protein|uniref:hypothetical protein n=1 Tax=Pseudomonas sp. IPO3774 TaxID=2738826 RepID=UPI0015A17D85|nr:hypothetical protein [Pseudomonas sp. IPO3774]NWD64216.1 hypothetical protein [Pseudomonas sp. IPO3774]